MSLNRHTRLLFWVLSMSVYSFRMLCIWRLLHAASNVKWKSRISLPLLFLGYIFSFTFTSSDSARAQSIALELVANNLNNPVAITHAGDGTGRLFITLQCGKIVIYNGTNVLATPFLGGCPTIMDGKNLTPQNAPGSTIGKLGGVLLPPRMPIFTFVGQPARYIVSCHMWW